jgi:FAD/FMN-containing dehydrogenase
MADSYKTAVTAARSVRGMTDTKVFSGPIHKPGTSGYEAGRAGFNLAVEHRPEFIVEATGVDDVVAAVACAVSSGRPVAVLNTGHGPTVPADGAVLINTRLMDRVEVDPVRRTARFGAGVRWREVIRAAAPYGLAPLNGSSPDVGAVGYTLGGGVGLLGRRHGYAADHVRAITVVTADGLQRQVTADSDADLFWALRGAGANFGVVTEMEVGLFPVARLLGGGLYFGAVACEAVLNRYCDLAADLPVEMASSVLIWSYPNDETTSAPLRGRHITEVRFANSGADPTAGRHWIKEFRRIGPPVLDTVRVLPYADMGTIYHEPTGIQVTAYDKNAMLAALDSQAAAELYKRAGPHAQAPFVAELTAFGGALARPPAVPNCVGGRGASFVIFAATEDLADNPARDAMFDALRPWGTGMSYLNFMGVEDARREAVQAAYTPEDFARLTELKARYDPDNTFRINHNIPPKTREI